MDLENRVQRECFTVPNRFSVSLSESDLSMQDAEGIFGALMSLLSRILERYKSICVIGLTGQMHGVLYVDRSGNVLSPLFTWQDKRAERVFKDGETYVGRAERLTEMHLPSGYGLVTHYYNRENRLVPTGAYRILTIMDYAVLRLTGNTEVPMHASNAASLGLFDVERNVFHTDKLEKLFPTDETLLLPRVTGELEICGHYQGIPVAVAIGDNQASFLGSVKNPNESILLNIGTGSQISALGAYRPSSGAFECRPLIGTRRLLCGSALCGGAAYALLERFFRDYIAACGLPNCPATSQYEALNRLADTAYHSGKPPLTVDTRFTGSRTDPAVRGAVLGIEPENFTPASLVLGVLFGICRELYALLPSDVCKTKKTLIASGNAVQKISVLREIMSEVFALPVSLSATKEEAAVGAALCAAVSAGLLQNTDEFADFIRYE